MVTQTLLPIGGLLVVAAALVMAGAAAAWTAPNAAKRIGALVVAFIGAVIGLAAAGAPNGALVAGVAAAFAYVAIGAAIIVRLQESYAAIDAPELDAADEQDEPAEPQP